MSEATEIERFSLLGGPLHRLGCRLGLVRDGANTIRLGLAIGAGLWVSVVVLALLGGVAPELVSVSAIGAHVRLLALIPLLFLGETWLEPRVEAFVSMIVRSGIVPTTTRPALDAHIARTTRLKDSWMAEAMCLAAAVLLPLAGPRWLIPGIAVAEQLSDTPLGVSWAGQWYAVVGLPIFRFLVVRWFWRLVLWWLFLWRISMLELHLVPTHPDGAGGLGYLEIVHLHFIPLVLVNSAVQSAALAQELSSGAATFEAVYPALALVAIVDVVLFFSPLLLVTPKLWACRVKGLSDYMVLAQGYVSDFEGKWLGEGRAGSEPLLGNADVQSLADLSTSVGLVRDMRIVPVSLRLALGIATAAALPMLPLFLFRYPLAELTQKFFVRLLGL